jgi:L-arabinonolactonase
MTTVSIACDHVDVLGEAPQWHGGEQRLYWVDAFAPAIRSLDPETGILASVAVAADIGSFVFTADGGVIAGMRGGFHRIDLATGQATLIANPLARDPRLMLNDGKCDRRGRYWCGSTNTNLRDPTGTLFRLDPDRSCRAMAHDTIVSNGIAWSPDDKTMYYADSRALTVWAYDFDVEAGTLSNRRPFISTRGLAGRVDGATVDESGNYWAALISSGCVGRFNPEGALEELIRLPVKNPAMCTFGGEDLDELYVVTSTRFTPDALRRQQPLAGGLFRVTGLGVRGLPEPRFAG